VSEVYDFFSDESPEYFDYDADRQGLGLSSIRSTVQLAEVPAPPRPTSFTFETFAEAVALAHPLPRPVRSTPVSPSLSYASLSGVTSTSSLPTELSLPESWASRSPSPIDYENIAGWVEEAEESEPLPPPVEPPQVEIPQTPEVSAGTPTVEVTEPEAPAGPIEFSFPAVDTAWSAPPPPPVVEEQSFPSQSTPQPPSPRPLTPLPPAEEARLENQENIPPLPPLTHTDALGRPCNYPHRFIAVRTENGSQWRPQGELSYHDILDVPTTKALFEHPPLFPSVTPFRGESSRFLHIQPVNEFLAHQLRISHISACVKAVRYLPSGDLPLGCIKYSFADGIKEVFAPHSNQVKDAFAGALVLLETLDFLDGRKVTTYGFLEFDENFVYVRSQGYHCEDAIRSFPTLLAYCFTPRIPVDPFVHVSVHPETIPL
jgi:hypothetical protein